MKGENVNKYTHLDNKCRFRSYLVYKKNIYNHRIFSGSFRVARIELDSSEATGQGRIGLLQSFVVICGRLGFVSGCRGSPEQIWNDPYNPERPLTTIWKSGLRDAIFVVNNPAQKNKFRSKLKVGNLAVVRCNLIFLDTIPSLDRIWN